MRRAHATPEGRCLGCDGRSAATTRGGADRERRGPTAAPTPGAGRGALPLRSRAVRAGGAPRARRRGGRGTARRASASGASTTPAAAAGAATTVLLVGAPALP